MSDKNYTYFQPPSRILLGPGPSMVDPRVNLAMASQAVGYMDPACFEVLDDIISLLQYAFQTDNEFTLVVSGTGSAGMESAVVNFVEPGTKVAVLANGFFSERLTEMCTRQQAEIVRLEKPWGEVLDADEAAEFIRRERPQIVTHVQAETSTGAFQNSKPICDAAHEVGALVIGDCVTSLGGMPVEVDANGIDIAYSATQKCLGAPAGLSPITLSPRAVERLEARQRKSGCCYIDLKLFSGYWHPPRAYHHTAPISLLYALHEALRIIPRRDARSAPRAASSQSPGARRRARGHGPRDARRSRASFVDVEYGSAARGRRRRRAAQSDVRALRHRSAGRASARWLARSCGSG